MLAVISRNQPYVSYMPNYELGRMVNHELKISRLPNPKSIELQEIKDGQIQSQPNRQTFFSCLQSKYKTFVDYGNRFFESVNEFGYTPTMQKLEAKSLIFNESYDRFLSVFEKSFTEVCLEPDSKDITPSEIFYRRVYAQPKHTFDSINSDLKIQVLKMEIMESLKPNEIERKAYDDDILHKLDLLSQKFK